MATPGATTTEGAAGALEVGVRPGAVRLSVKVRPRSSKTALRGVEAGALVVALAAPPVDGEANAALVVALAGWLGVRRRDVTIVSGETARTKIVEVAGVAPSVVAARLGVGLA
ncbi:MAG: DUF167 domain-containing protein [Polyangiaceae bacterium]|nr:DUF167 domain-containing protein [Polyangiaceae bacterium]